MARFSLGKHRQEVSIFVASSLALVVKGIEEKKETSKPNWIFTSILLPHVNFLMKHLPRFDTVDTLLPAWFGATQFIAEEFAWLYWKGKNLTEAAQLYEQVLGGIHIYKDSVKEGKLRLSEIGENLGRVLWELGELDRAEAFLKHAFDNKVGVLRWQHDSAVEAAEILGKGKERNRIITAMEECSRNTASTAKVAPKSYQPDEVEPGMEDTEWQIYQTIEDSTELLGTEDEETIKAILDLGEYRHARETPPEGTFRYRKL